jgi:hypothetical protein
MNCSIGKVVIRASATSESDQVKSGDPAGKRAPNEQKRKEIKN